MIKRLVIIPALAVLLACLSGKVLFGQKVILTTEKDQASVVDLSSSSCRVEGSALQISDAGLGGLPLRAVAMYRKSTFMMAGALVQRIEQPMRIIERFIAHGDKTTVLTVDRTGMLYWVDADNQLVTSTTDSTKTPIRKIRGKIPFNATGDMVFYKDKLFLTAEGGVVEVDISDPGRSKMVLPTPGREFPGLINVAAGCDSNRVFGIEADGTTTHLVEFDLDRNRIVGVYCSFNLGSKISDAGSPNETGERPFIAIDSLFIKSSCQADTNKSTLRVSAYTPAGDSGLTYTLRKGASLIGPFSPGRGLVTITQPIEPGTWNLNITSSSGCTLDTTLVIINAGKVAATVQALSDTCNSGRGSAIVTLTEGIPPYTFEVEGKGIQTLPVITSLSPGNYKLSVKDSTSCSINLNFTVSSYTPPVPIANISIIPSSFCNDGEVRISYLSSANVLGARLDNDNFAVSTHFTGVSAGIHRLQVKTGNCVFDTLITIPASSVPPAIDSVVISNTCLGRGSIHLVMSGAEAPYRFRVDGGLYNSGTTVMDIPSGIYPVIIYNASRCIVDTVQLMIREKGVCDTMRAIYVPSAFTPNGDGKNDVLLPLTNPVGKLTRFVFRVYNRIGQIVFETRSPVNGWDGRYKGIQQPGGVYVWMFQGTETDGKQVTYKGTTVLLR